MTVSPAIKPIILLLAMIFLSFIIGQALINIKPKKTETETIRFRKQASSILEKLVSSESCLAVKEGEKIIDLDTLIEFHFKYSDIEPECARSYDYGYDIEVEIPRINTWRFGSRGHSEYDALKSSVMLSTPVMIEDEDKIYSGTIKIRMYKGELEELVGLIDKTCDTGLEIVKNIHLSYPVEFSANSVCMRAMNKFCRRVACERVVFDGVDHPGNYTFVSRRDLLDDFVVVEKTKID